MLDKSEWFKTKWSKKTQDAMGEESPEDVRELVCSQAQSKRKPWKRFGKQQSVKSQSQGRSMKTRTVLFVEQTRDGLLAKSIREVLTRLEGLLGFKVKVVERAGTSLRNLMPNTNPCGQGSTAQDQTVLPATRTWRTNQTAQRGIWSTRTSAQTATLRLRRRGS